METEKAKLETLTDSANMYGSKSKCQSSWVDNTKRASVEMSVLGIRMPTDNKQYQRCWPRQYIYEEKKLLFIDSYLSSHKYFFLKENNVT